MGPYGVDDNEEGQGDTLRASSSDDKFDRLVGVVRQRRSKHVPYWSHTFIEPYIKVILDIKFLREIVLMKLRVDNVSQCRRSHQRVGHVQILRKSASVVQS